MPRLLIASLAVLAAIGIGCQNAGSSGGGSAAPPASGGTSGGGTTGGGTTTSGATSTGGATTGGGVTTGGATTSGATTGGATTGGATTGGSTGTTPPPPTGPLLRVSGWDPFWASTGLASVNNNVGTIDEVNPTWYALQADGTLHARSGSRDPQWIADRHTAGMLVIPMIDDFSGTAKGAGPVIRDVTPGTRATLMTSILSEVDTLGLDGIDIDFEGMGMISRDPFSQFMGDLATELHNRGKLLTMAAYPKLSEPGGWSGPQSHNYAALGAVVDEFKIMLYAGTGPVAALPDMKKYLDFALTLVPAGKIFAGINFYGFDKSASGKTALTETTGDALATALGITPQLDPTSGELNFQYTSSTGVAHDVWYVNGPAIGLKCDLALQEGVRGIAIWRLGSEKADIWTAIQQHR
jgi:spore germination protein YaaH